MKAKDPLAIFREWYQEASDAGITDPTIMTLATVDGEGKPAARIVLLKSFDEKGFVFYTNYHEQERYGSGQASPGSPGSPLERDRAPGKN